MLFAFLSHGNILYQRREVSQSSCHFLGTPIFVEKYVGTVCIVVAVAHAEVRVFLSDVQEDAISQHVRALLSSHLGRLLFGDKISLEGDRQEKTSINFQ
jgi:hypothetical protein